MFLPSLAPKKGNNINFFHQTLVSSIGEGIIETDQSGQIIAMNKWAQEILGFKAEEYIGKILPKEVLIEKEKGYFVPWDTLLDKASTSKDKQTDVMFHSTQDESKFLTPATIAPVIGESKIIGAVVILPDISREREIETMKSEFLSLAAHQLRSPLGSIRWGIEMIMAGDLGKITSKVKETLTQIYASNQWMIALVNDLLNVSRIDQGRIQDEPELFDYIESIKAVIAEQQLEAQKRSIKIKLEVKNITSAKIMINPRRFREVIQNLLSNAVKYNRNGGRVTIVVDQSELLVKIIVTDTGIGIPKKDEEEIFSRFFRASNALKSKTDGTGLGLFMVKSYVTSWGGSIWFESTQDKGTKFYIQFPTQKIEHRKS